MSDSATMEMGNIAWLANYIARDPELDKHGDRMFVFAWQQTKDRYTENEFTLAIVKLVQTLREQIRMDELEATLATEPEPEPVYVKTRARPRPRPRRARRQPAQRELDL